MNRILASAIVALLIVSAVLAWTTERYHGNAVKYKDQRDTATHNLTLANETISDMEVRQRDVAALDARYTKELADAKAENDALRDDVAAGRRRLLVNATCPAMPTGKSTATARVDNAARPRLADSAQRDYFTLKERVTTMQKQLEGAQTYIRTQCHSNAGKSSNQW
ncbi:lysis protein [Salmonella enterica subsp. enterica serovar Stanley]|uniref:Lysis protein n=1 Tax=Salmonella enterica TaxID=28901 RepID=A0A5V2R575_SALER|nr:lysis protein [Salmonella enterica subsp. enterica serovar Typhimurium]EAU2554687.1 lysis protein [Salmonella enterica]EBK2388313.1 lysis protein [Salmonella enterica subsp. enterica serovar Heidelberg]EBV5761568.1 lysis protein [Salmonella enterica subsp. enterica serovar Hvittingfoss]EBW5051243.1 lysis protein [Salmonella enterica subsp. enterica serovar Stanley]ECI0592966.1 lysis protein [Salmonella enterica subsp. enterica serovar Virchow]EEJ8494089.1 lysis protein [Salmonella enterica